MNYKEVNRLERRNVGREISPHPDGNRESIINSPRGMQFGVRTDKQNEEKLSSLGEIKDEQLKRFEELMRGSPVDNTDTK
jgi:hypothetical protein